MLQKALPVALIAIIVSSTAFAGDARVEISPFIGYTFSEGIDFDNVELPGGSRLNRITPVSGLSYGFVFDVLASEQMSVGFEFAQQRSKLEGSLAGEGKQEFTDMNVNNYHGLFTYNFGWKEDKARPFIFGGIGATQYSPSDLEGQSIDSSTKFSTTWGGGVKVYASEHVALRFTGRWTPTYISSDPGGVWCSPYWTWNCWVVSEANYSHQFEMQAGVTFRF